MALETAGVIDNRPWGGADYWRLDLAAPALAAAANPGQFVHLRVPRLGASVLRRPFSIYRAEAGRLSLLYKAVGAGTRAMTGLRAGDTLSLMGPLGHGYPPLPSDRFPLLVAGGYGVAALYLVAQRAPIRGTLFIGGATAAHILLPGEFEALGWTVRIATEDGSLGIQGLVTRLLDGWIQDERGGRTPEFCACGPNGMLQAVGARARQGNWTAWLSMDRHMGCGMGACLACVQRVRARTTEDGRQRTEGGGRTTEGRAAETQTPGDGEWKWARVCTEGPVFECRDICWD